MSDLIYIGKDVQSFQKSNRFEPYDRVVLNLDDNNYISSPSVSVTDASVYDRYANGTYEFSFSPEQGKWKTPSNSYVTTSELASSYGLTVHFSDITSPKSGDVITVTKTTVDGSVEVVADLARSGSTLSANCPLVKPSDRQTVADNLLKRVYGFTYQPYSAKGAYMNPAAEIGDAITAYNVFSGLFEQNTTFNRLFLSDIGSAISEEAAVEMKYEMNTDRRYNRKLAETAAQFAIMSDRISSFVTNQAFQAALDVMANQISAKVSGTGGNTDSFAWSLSTDGFTLYANGAQVFKCDQSGITVNGTGTFTGEIYAANIRSDAVNGYGGSFSGSGITPASIVPAQCSEGIVQSLGYADFFNAAIQPSATTYPQNFTAARIDAYNAFYSGMYKVREQGEVVYDLTAHYHSFTERNGKIYMSAPTGDSSHANFNIADTETYKAAVPAGRAVLYCNATNYQDVSAGYDCDMTGASYHYDVDGVTYGRIAIRNSSGTDLKTIRVKLPASTGEITNSVTITGAQSSSATNRGVITATAATNTGVTATGTYNIYLNVTENTSSRVTVVVLDGSSNQLATRSFTPQTSGKTVSGVNITRAGYNDYYWTGSAWHIPVKARVTYSDSTYDDFTGDISVQDVVEAAQREAGCAGHVEVTSTSGNSAFIKIYNSSWSAVPVGGSSVGKWITAGTSETFG